MDMTIILARVFGVYFLIAAAMVFTNRRALMLGVTSMFKERFAELLAGMIALMGGLFYVNVYQDWSSFPSSLLSLFGWLIIAKGLIYGFTPEIHLAKLTHVLTERSWYTMDGILALVLGIYLTGFGYGVW